MTAVWLTLMVISTLKERSRPDEERTMMKKIIFAICFLYLGFPFPSQGMELKFVTQDFPPFNYEVGKVVSGPAADIIREICNEMKINVSFQSLPWRRAQDRVRKGEAHGMFVIGWNEERATWLYFSPPLLKTEYGFFVRKDRPFEYRKPEDIAGANVAVFGPSNTSNSLEKLRSQMIASKLQPINIQMEHDDILVFKMLNQGGRTIDLIYSNRDVGNAIIHQANLKNIRYAGLQKQLKYYIGFSQEYTDKKIVDQFNATFKKLHKAGIIKKILAGYNMEAI